MFVNYDHFYNSFGDLIDDIDDTVIQVKDSSNLDFYRSRTVCDIFFFSNSRKSLEINLKNP